MKNILKELQKQQNIRTNLSTLRQLVKDEIVKAQLLSEVAENESLFLSFLKHEDAKTRKNAALLFGDLAYQNAADALYQAYEEETTLFVRASYLQALAELDAADKLESLKQCLDKLVSEEPLPENKKHVEEEIRALRRMIIRHEGISRHTAELTGKKVTALPIEASVRQFEEPSHAEWQRCIHWEYWWKPKSLPSLWSFAPIANSYFRLISRASYRRNR